LLTTLMRSLQVELDQFFSNIELPQGRFARDDAFRMARKKLKASAFSELNDHIVADAPTRSRWHGLRVLAADSTTLMLPATHPDTCSPDVHRDHGHDSLARGAGLCDTSTGLMLRADIESDAKGEREMLVEQLAEIKNDDLLVLDRCYPAYWLFVLLNLRGLLFCMRLTTSFNSTVKNFVASGAASMRWTIQPGKPQKQVFKSHDLPMTSFQLRLVRVLLPSGQVEVLVTNLLDEERWPSAEFSALYHRRWRIEEAFRHLKARLKLEQFGGETPLAIRQETTPPCCCTTWRHWPRWMPLNSIPAEKRTTSQPI